MPPQDKRGRPDNYPPVGRGLLLNLCDVAEFCRRAFLVLQMHVSLFDPSVCDPQGAVRRRDGCQQVHSAMACERLSGIAQRQFVDKTRHLAAVRVFII